MSSQIQTRRRADSFSDYSSPDAEKVLYILKAMGPQAFYDRLMTHLQPESASVSSNHDALLEALKLNGFAGEVAKAEGAVEDDEERHCVRCHVSYLEKNNARDACVIKHAYPVVGSTSGSNLAQGQAQQKPCPSCHSSLPCASSCVVTPTCFVGRHTTNAQRAYAQKSPLVKTCDELKCGEDTVKAIEKGFIMEALSPTALSKPSSFEFQFQPAMFGVQKENDKRPRKSLPFTLSKPESEASSSSATKSPPSDTSASAKTSTETTTTQISPSSSETELPAKDAPLRLPPAPAVGAWELRRYSPSANRGREVDTQLPL
ncbi:hypothetical protein CC1G_10739 [Coprinopsis cinerea okayama7|uniref:Uncharacterized protein n=1 Tax=Coprinopsis cinerea (strain Okayama-7 / 130 / ATCC MYA-4618 / FGSC 9003) TaxID=240176 RepID=A8P392_COPC7|nr:hypothetical protein CC1G_10739 [Coprinopsis cinerea okayama7\|eukprot:XP_001838497.1 hypothetical protein CC1G_10739 [Coprinopsis cinerea okayama7\